MHKLYYQPEGYWFGDCMPFYKDGKFYLYHQRDTRNPGPFGEPFGWALATTSDFVHFEDHGESLLRGGDDEQDQFIFAGSVFEAEGKFYAMYTGFNRDYPKQGKASQVLMIAVSDDLIHWQKTTEKLVVPQEGYDPNEWRDPFVFKHPDSGEYVMILGARHLEGGKIRTGCTVYFTSKDLKHWEFQGDFWAPNLYYMHEMPDIFKINDWWYLLTTEYSDKNKTVYRMSRSLDGPWTAPVDDAFDGRAYYAARSVSDGEHRYLFGWVPTKEEDEDLGKWQWGGTLVVHEVVQRPDGSLAAQIPTGVLASFDEKTELLSAPLKLGSADGVDEQLVAQNTGDLFLFESRVKFTAGTRKFGIRLYENEASGEAYELIFNTGENEITFSRTPFTEFQFNERGLQRPFQFEADREYLVQIVVDDTIATVYIDGVAMNARMYAKFGEAIVLYAVEGKLTVTAASIQKA